MKKLKKIRLPKFVVPLVLLVVFSVLTLSVLLPRLPFRQKGEQNKGYKGVVELWNVESFEGGIGSREAWFTSRAAQFEKTHSGLFVHVTTLTESQLKEKLDCGEMFDALCFSRGVGCLVQNLLQPYTGSVADVKDNLLLSGEVGGSVFALPVFCGSYCLFARESQLPQNAQLVDVALSCTFTKRVGKTEYKLQPLLCGFTSHNSPFSALAMSGGHGTATADTTLSQYQAYEKFVDGKTAVMLLGTQRDLYRLSKREAGGKMEKLAFCALSGYTDLVAYLGISLSAEEKQSAVNEFFRFLISESSQQTLVNLGMFSVLEKTFYTDERYLACEKGLISAFVPGAFGDSQSIASQRQTALSTLGM